MIKRITITYAATNRDLVQTTRRFGSGKLVLNITTGEIRKGPGKWDEMQTLADADLADVTVAAATTGNVDISTALVTGEELDGVTLVAGTKVGVFFQTNQAQNGIYTVGATPARATDFATFAAHAGTTVKVAAGAVNANKQFLCTSGKDGTLNSSSIDFVPLHSALQRDLTRLAGTATAGDTMKVLVLQPDGNLGVLTGLALKTYTNA